MKRVVMTSSVGAVVGDHWERGAHHVYTEDDWNQTATETFLPYHRQDHTVLILSQLFGQLRLSKLSIFALSCLTSSGRSSVLTL